MNVLIIEGNPDLRIKIMMLAEHLKHVTLTAPSRGQGIGWLQSPRFKVHLVISDLVNSASFVSKRIQGCQCLAFIGTADFLERFSPSPVK